MSDSQLVIQFLTKEFEKQTDLDSWLTPEQHGVAHAVRKMLEESTYFVFLRQRFEDEKSWEILKKETFAGVPALLAPVISWKVRRNILASLWGQGIGRYPKDDYWQIAAKDLDAVSAILGKNKFIMGDKPCSIDATVYSFVIHSIWVPFEFHPLIIYCRSHNQNLIDYAERMQTLYFPDLVPECKPKNA